jgi:hypothetical protein
MMHELSKIHDQAGLARALALFLCFALLVIITW